MLYLLTLQSIISAFVFVFRTPKHISNYILAIWFIINAMGFVNFLIPQGLASYIEIGYIPFLFLNGPILFFYVKSLITINFRFKWKHALHLIPFFLLCIYRLATFDLSENPTFYYVNPMPLKYLILYFFITSSLIIYLTAIFVLVTLHRRNIGNYFSNVSQRQTLTWVNIVMNIIAISYIIKYFAPLMPELLLGTNTVFWYNQFNLGLLGFLILVCGLLQPEIYIDKPVNQEEREEFEGIEELEGNIQQLHGAKYTRSGLSKEELFEMSQTIQKYILISKPYLNPDYSLELMAKDLNITRQNLSQAINDEIGKNFYQLINEFRVNEFKKYLIDPKMSHITFLGLAYEAGFNSKSSFYRLFKEITGETPTEYSQRLKSNKLSVINQANTIMV